MQNSLRIYYSISYDIGDIKINFGLNYMSGINEIIDRIGKILYKSDKLKQS